MFKDSSVPLLVFLAHCSTHALYYRDWMGVVDRDVLQIV